MSKIESKPERLNIEHYYWNPFELIIQMYNADGTVYNLTDSIISAGMKLTKTATSFTVDFTESHSNGEIALSATSAALIAGATQVPKNAFWDFRIDNKSFLAGDFDLSDNPKKKTSTNIILNYRDASIIRLIIGLDNSVSYLRAVVGTTAERDALAITLTTNDRILFIDTTDGSFYVWNGSDWI